MRRTLVAVAGVGVLLAACVVFLPAVIVRGDLASADALSAADRLKATNDVRATLLQGLAALLALGGIALGAMVTMRQIRVSREGQFIDLFTKAIEHLASDQVNVRHGGVYAMEQIAEAAPHYRGHVAALLASFVRQQAPWPPTGDSERERYHGGLRDDVGGAIAALSRRAMVLPGTSIELEKVDLREADLAGQNLSRFCFAGANLDGATLSGCDLSDATFTGASLRNTDLTGARLTGADLTGADLTGADTTAAIGIGAGP
jgi:hypothetical protein